MWKIERAFRNVIANLMGAAGFAILTLVFNYFYFRILGDEAYGVVTSFLTLTALLSLFDFGISRTTFRELARRSSSSDLMLTARSVVMTLQLLQWCVFLALGAAVVALSPFIATWLNARTLSHETIVTSIALSGMCIAIAQPRILYRSGLNGLGQQVTRNVLQGCSTIIRGVSSLVVLSVWGPQIELFFIAQLCGFAIESLITGAALWRVLPAGNIGPRLSILKEIRQYASADGASSIVSIFLATGDKVVLSRIVSLEQFGQYGLVTLICQTLPTVIEPFANAYFHEFTVAWQKKDLKMLSLQYQGVSEIVNPISIAGGLALILFAFEILTLLTGSREVAGSLALPMQLYALGSIFWSLLYIPHMLTLAAGWPGLWLLISTLASLAYIPALYLLAPIWGLTATSALWFTANLVMFPLFIHLMHKRLLPEMEFVWIRSTVVKPAIIVTAVLLAARAVLRPAETTSGIFGELVLVAAAAGISLVLAAPKIRMWTLFAAKNVAKLARTVRE